MAIVFLGHDLRHKRDVAIKVLRPDLVLAVSPDRFLREIQIAAQLQHPMILPLFDSGQADGLFYYVMPFVVGESLRDRLKREKRLPVEDAVRIGREVAEALHYAHAHGVVHRDIKPENILLSGGHPLVADFGVARALGATGGEHLTATGLVLGTPCYMSPEQVLGDPKIDGRSDIYSLGCVVYEMIGGDPPFSGPSAQAIVAGHLGMKIPSLAALCPTVPAAVRVTIETALAKEVANRFQTSLEFAEALANPRPAKRRRGPLNHTIRRSILAATGGIALVAGAWGAWSQWWRAERSDPNLIAVAPFDVIGTGAAIWREGVMDLLSRNLDGAGPLRAVSPAVVLRNWSELADAASAERLGRRTGAGLCVVGSVVSSGRDSVLLSASVLDLGTGETLGEVRVGGITSRIDLAVDSLTMALLGAMGRTRAIGAVQLASVHSASLPALKAYLQGEQYFRRAAWDSAGRYFERAAELDPGFALALHRISETRGFPTPGNDSLVWTYALRAGALNRGLALRESLLVAADSILAPIIVGSTPDTMAPHSASRGLATLQVAARQFPNDAEVWYQLGKARNQFGWIVGVTTEQALEPLNRSIGLDSAFAPAYVEAIQIAMVARGPEATERYLAAYLRLKPTGRPADVALLAHDLMNPKRAHSPEAERILDTASAVLLYQTHSILEWWPDSAETATRVARRLVTRPQDPNLSPDPAFARRVLSYALAWRGHLQEAYRVWDGKRLGVLSQLALLGGVPRDTASAIFGRLLRTEPWPRPTLVFALPWWSQTGDTISLTRWSRGPKHSDIREMRARGLATSARPRGRTSPWGEQTRPRPSGSFLASPIFRITMPSATGNATCRSDC